MKKSAFMPCISEKLRVLTPLFREQDCGNEGDEDKILLYFFDFSFYFCLMFFQTDGLSPHSNKPLQCF